MNTQGLGVFVRQRRGELGLTQNELGAKTGLTQAYISQIERGVRRWPQPYVRAIADVLGVSEIQLAQEAGLISRQPEGKDGE